MDLHAVCSGSIFIVFWKTFSFQNFKPPNEREHRILREALVLHFDLKFSNMPGDRWDSVCAAAEQSATSGRVTLPFGSVPARLHLCHVSTFLNFKFSVVWKLIVARHSLPVYRMKQATSAHVRAAGNGSPCEPDLTERNLLKPSERFRKIQKDFEILRLN